MLSEAERGAICGVILAGGRGQRMHGEDKGLVQLAGRPLAAYVLAALRPQVGKVLINANRNVAAYAELGCPVVQDELNDYQGPLAGLASAMAAAHSDYVLTVPCDGPRLPHDLAERLYRTLWAEGATIAVAYDGERLQPVHALVATDLLPDLHSYLAGGDRKIDLWFDRHALAVADFSDHPETFRNVNTPEDRVRLEQELSSRA